MRIGVFDVDFTIRPILSIAEVISGKASLLHSLHVKNIRGSEKDWINIVAKVGGMRTKQIAIRHIPVYNQSIDKNNKTEWLTDLTLPASMQPGKHEVELIFSYSDNRRTSIYPSGETSQKYTLTILSSSWVPTDLAHAPYLAAWIHSEENELRAFAAEACKDLNNNQPLHCIHALYNALVCQNLMYQPVVSTLYPDFQPISDWKYALQKGGSCMDLSLLLSSLLWVRGLSPTLLLYGDHLTAGCFPNERYPDFEVLNDPKKIENMILQHQLILPEITDVCSDKQTPFENSLNNALKWLQQHSSAGCCLVNIKTVLRSGTTMIIPDSLHEESLICPVCGYDHIPPQEAEEMVYCPACGHSFKRVSHLTPTPAITPDAIYDPKQIRYECRNQNAGVVRCLPSATDSIRILPCWQNKPVTYIATEAFENSAISSIVFPESITVIMDRAFRGCEKLESVQLPPNLSRLGSGVFSSSGLKSICIPGSVSRIPVFCFSGCKQLETVTLENGVQEIDSQAFIHCPKLKYIYLPPSVQKVSEAAFDSTCQLIYFSTQTSME